MKKEKAEKLIKIILSADGGCEYCVSDSLRLFSTEFPEHRKRAKTAFKDNFRIEFKDFLKEQEGKGLK